MEKKAKVGFWVLQVLMAIIFTLTGVMKLSTPIDELAKAMSWVGHTQESMVRLIGLAELLGAIGLIVPSVTRIFPVLTPIAAAALSVLMIGGTGTHILLGEMSRAAIPAVLAVLCAFLAKARFGRYSIRPRDTAVASH